MQRVLDIDLDAFVYGATHFVGSDGPRLDEEEFPPWELRRVLDFLELQCLVTEPLPGCAVEHHDDVFRRWRDAIDAGVLMPPFHVTHVDAHADLGLGDGGYIYLLTELLCQSLAKRRDPQEGDGGLGDGNYLAFAVANRWISDLMYVVGGRSEVSEISDAHVDYDWIPGDLLIYVFENFDPRTRTIRLPTLEAKNLRANLVNPERLKPLSFEPPVPFDWRVWSQFQAAKPYDLIYLARSPAFTPKAADLIYEEIRARFIQPG